MADITSVHDTFVRAILADKNIAIDYFQASLPVYVLEKLDLSTLTQLPNTYVSKELEKTVSDIVYSCLTNDRKGEVKISLLVEHKSYIDKYAPIQIGSYIFSGLLKQIRNRQKPSLIIPILLYHGRKQWEYRTLSALFDDLDLELKGFVPDYKYVYHNLGQISDDQIQTLQNKFLAASFLALKYSLSKAELRSLIPTILSLVEFVEGVDPNLQSSLIVYIFVSSDLREEQIIAIVELLPLTIKRTVMNTLDVFVEKGIKIGEEKNTEKAVRNMILEGFSTETICKVLEVTPNYVATIRKEIEKEK